MKISQKVGCGILGLAFVVSGTIKASDASDFFQSIQNFRVIPKWGAEVLSYYLPWLEITLGISVVSGFWRKEALMLIFGMITFFSLALISAWARGLDVQCVCFGEWSMTALKYEPLLRNMFFLIGCLWLLRSDAGKNAESD